MFSFRIGHMDDPPLHPHTARQYQTDRLRIEPVLDGMDALEQAGLGIPNSDGHGFLEQDRAVIHLLINEMHGDSGHLRPPGQRVTNRVGAGK